MTVRATQKYIRMSARKLRLVADLVRGRDLAEINTVLSGLNKRGARVINETIRQAVANAVNNMGFSEQQLSLKSIMVNEGPTYKRVIAKGRGRAGSILKRTSHVHVELGIAELAAEKATAPEAAAEVTPEVVEAEVVETAPVETEKKAAAPKKTAPKKTATKAPAKKAVAKTTKKKEA
jgi:large subunit ribosomal protein L22